MMDATAFALPEADSAEEGAWQPGNPNMRLLQEIDVRLSVEVGATSHVDRSTSSDCTTTAYRMPSCS